MATFTLRHTAIGLVAAMSVIGAGRLAYALALDAGLERIAVEADDRLRLLASTLEATVERFRYLPAVLAQADPIRSLYRTPSAPQSVQAANRYLESLNQAARSADLYVVDRTGLTLAASNYLQEETFIGQNYAFRPYFQNALRDGEGRYYAVGATTRQPGYFLSHRINDGDRTLGVAVVKVDLGGLESNWPRAGELVAVVDANGIAFLTSRPQWRYRPLSGLSARQMKLLAETKQYGDAPLGGAPLFAAERVWRGARIVEIADAAPQAGADYVLHSYSLPTHGWTLLALFAIDDVHQQAAAVAAAVGFCALALMLVALAVWQRRQVVRAKLEAHDALERRVAERTQELTATNLRLSMEIEERIRAGRNLRLAQEKLIQAAKLASLGQVLAGVAHEINQPLSALTVYIASTRLLLERGDMRRALGNLTLITSIIDRMGSLTRQLKTFARKDSGAKSVIDLAPAVGDALRLLAYRLKDEDITQEIRLPVHPIYVTGDHIRVEQVVVNLVSNALDAMRDRPLRRLSIDLRREANSAVLEIADTGQGIPHEHISTIFDPFFTTKEVGRGLGLGLSISYGIVHDMDGEIVVRSEIEAGTTFRVTFPVAGAPSGQPLVESLT